MVLQGHVDFAIDSFGITNERMDEIDYLILTEGGRGRIYIRNPKDGVDWNVYTKPLRKEAWIGILFFSILVPIIMMGFMFRSKIIGFQ